MNGLPLNVGNSNPASQVKTSWSVITGGASSGKTTLCLALSAHSYSIIPEAARLLIDIRISEGVVVPDIRKDYFAFQREVLKAKVEFEKLRKPQSRVFLDRGIPDSCAYGLSFEEVKRDYFFEYEKVFFLESVGFQQDYARVESEQEAKQVAKDIYQAYRDFGYEPVRVPKMPVLERMKFILAELGISQAR